MKIDDIDGAIQGVDRIAAGYRDDEGRIVATETSTINIYTKDVGAVILQFKRSVYSAMPVVSNSKRIWLNRWIF